MPNLRKRSAVLTYNDDAVFRAIENLRKRSKIVKKPAKPKASLSDGQGIPDVVFAADGRKFFPCQFCCRAFAVKKDQLAHMQLCNFKDDVKTEASTQANAIVNKVQMLPKQKSLENGKVIPHKAQPNGLQTQTKVKGTQGNVQHGGKKISNVAKVATPQINSAKSNSVQSTTPQKLAKANPLPQNNLAKSNLVPRATNKTQNKISVGAITKAVPNGVQIDALKHASLKTITAEKAATPKPPVLAKVPNTVTKPKPKTPPQGKNSPPAQNETSKNITFPKIKLGAKNAEERIKAKKAEVLGNRAFNTCIHCGIVFDNQGSLIQHKREKHTYARVLVSAEKLKEYNELYKKSNGETCTLCYKPITKKCWYKHLQTHSEEKKYTCGICKKSFGRKDHRDIHEKKHIVDSFIPA